MKSTSLRCCFAGLFTLLATSALAQPGPDRRAEGRVIVYADANFQGPSFVLYPGDRLLDFAHLVFDGNLPLNDQISSIRVEGPVEAYFYVDAHLQGDALLVRGSLLNLAREAGPSRRGNWNDLISSATVARLPPPRPRWPEGTGRGSVSGPRVELYSDEGFRGSRLVLTPGDRIPNLDNFGFEDGMPANDQISSIRLVGGAVLVAYEDAQFRGDRLTVEDNVPNLAHRNDRRDGRSWNDVISSLAVTTRQALAQTDVTITRAYRELLGREPDASSLQHYSRAMREQGYSETELRNEIRRSREFRMREAESAVRRVYREILQRDADPDGLAHYQRLMVDQSWSESRVRDALRLSEEFRRRQEGGG